MATPENDMATKLSNKNVMKRKSDRKFRDGQLHTSHSLHSLHTSQVARHAEAYLRLL